MSDEKFERLPLNPIEERRQKIEDKYGKNSYTARQLMPIIDYLVKKLDEDYSLNTKYTTKDKYTAAMHLLDFALGGNSDRRNMLDFSEAEIGALLNGRLGKLVKNTSFYDKKTDSVSVGNFLKPEKFIRQCDDCFKEIFLIVKHLEDWEGSPRKLEYNRFKLGILADDIRNSFEEMYKNYHDLYEDYVQKFSHTILMNFDDQTYNNSSDVTDEEEAFRSINYNIPHPSELKDEEKIFPFEKCLWTPGELLNEVVDELPTNLHANQRDYGAYFEDDVKFDDDQSMDEDKTHDYKR